MSVLLTCVDGVEGSGRNGNLHQYECKRGEGIAFLGFVETQSLGSPEYIRLGTVPAFSEMVQQIAQHICVGTQQFSL